MEFTIYRPNWRRGGNNNDSHYGDTALLNSQGMMCCLGQIGCAIGVPLEVMRAVGEPCDIKDVDKLENVDGLLVDIAADDYEHTKNSELTAQAMHINDNGMIGDEVREGRLSVLFAQNGHKLTFTDDLAPWIEQGTWNEAKR